MRTFLTRREALVGLLVAAGCGSSQSEPPAAVSPADAGAGPPSPPPQPVDAGSDDVAPLDAAVAETGPDASSDPLAGIDAIVVLMMENRSFDHFLGALRSDSTYANAASVEGLTGTESNPIPEGGTVASFKMTNFTPADPPHGWDACHAQWNGGANDGFVKAHAGASQADVMGYHDRSQLPFYYFLADHFTVCDHWFASVMGPTWPNRFYLHACTSNGKKDNTPFFTGAPTTLWKRLKDAGKTFKNYTAGAVTWYTGAFIGELLSLNPSKPMSEFFDDAKKGTLPNFSIIDPDFFASDDHPSHDIRLGQAFVATVYNAIAASPQWERTLLVITYDEHGGFFDHVPPPTTTDPNAGFDRVGFRVPTFVIGGRVKSGHVEKTVFDHASVGATVKARFGIASLGARMDAAATLASCIDPAKRLAPSPPPQGAPVPVVPAKEALAAARLVTSQPELAEVVRDGVRTGRIPRDLVDRRPHEVRVGEWLGHGVRLGAVEVRS